MRTSNETRRQKKNCPSCSGFSSSVHDWQAGTRRCSLLIHTHQSHHYVLKQCRVGGEGCQSSHAEKKKHWGKKACLDRQQLLPPRRFCFYCVAKRSFEKSGAVTKTGCPLPQHSHTLTHTLFIFWMSCLVWLAVWQQTSQQMQEGRNLQVAPNSGLMQSHHGKGNLFWPTNEWKAAQKALIYVVKAHLMKTLLT